MNSILKTSATILIALLLSFVQMSCDKDKVGDENGGHATVESYYPNSGNAGTLVNIVGADFGSERAGVKVTFGNTEGEIVQVTDKKIVVRAPSSGSTGDIKLQVGGQTIDIGEYTYQSLSIHSVSPQKIQAGAEIHITGEGFGSVGEQPLVTINGKQAMVMSATSGEIVAVVPAEVGSGAIEVKLGNQSSTGPVLQYIAIAAIQPISGGIGTRVTISGEGFSEVMAENSVEFNGIKGEVLEASGTALVVRAPADVVTGDIIVKFADGQVNGPVFTVVPPPALEVVSPLSGPSGIEMTISGDNYSTKDGETLVYINNQPLAYTFLSEQEIRLTIPDNISSGKVKVVVNDQVTEGPEFKSQNLGITKLSRDNGLAGTQVTISGIGFSADMATNTVSFNGVAGQVLSATETSITVLAPAGLTTGQLTVSTNGLTAYAPTEFRRAGVETVVDGTQLGFQLPGTTSVMTTDDQGNLYFGVQNKHAIYKVTPNGVLSVFAGSGTGESGNVDGTGLQARLNLSFVIGLVFDSKTQKLYFADQLGAVLRSITLDGKVETVYSPAAKIHYVTVGHDGRLYMSQERTRRIVVLDPVTLTSSLVYGPSSDFGNTESRFVGADGNMYYGGTYITQYYNITTDPAQRDNNWYRLPSSSSAMGRMDENNILLFHGSGWLISTVDIRNKAMKILFSWSSGTGFVDGDGLTAKFSNQVNDIDATKDGNIIYVLDNGNNAIRKVYIR